MRNYRGPIPAHSEVQFEPFRLTSKPPPKLDTFPNNPDMSSHAPMAAGDLERPMRKRLGKMRRHGLGFRNPKPKPRRRDHRGRFTK
jgi:hypothetical protein